MSFVDEGLGYLIAISVIIYIMYSIECCTSSTRGYTHNHDGDPDPHVKAVRAEEPCISFHIQVWGYALKHSIGTLLLNPSLTSAITMKHGTLLRQRPADGFGAS